MQVYDAGVSYDIDIEGYAINSGILYASIRNMETDAEVLTALTPDSSGQLQISGTYSS